MYPCTGNTGGWTPPPSTPSPHRSRPPRPPPCGDLAVSRSGTGPAVAASRPDTLSLKEVALRTVVVTGGATGIGRAVAETFARAGEQVVVTGRREELLRQTAAAIGATPVVFDAADPASVAAALPLLPDEVDVLVNNAGGNTDFGRTPVDDGDLVALAASWRANLDANLMSAVLVTSALTPRLREGARIVTIGSIAARLGAGSYYPRRRGSHRRLPRVCRCRAPHGAGHPRQRRRVSGSVKRRRGP